MRAKDERKKKTTRARTTVDNEGKKSAVGGNTGDVQDKTHKIYDKNPINKAHLMRIKYSTGSVWFSI